MTAPHTDDPAASARAAGLRYTHEGPGLRRVRCGKGFRYVGPDGTAVRDTATLERIRSLVIPPAWERVWICPDPRGHLQATGRDARGRKQYRYHARFRAVRDEAKYGRLAAFAVALPAIRARTDADLSLPGLPRPKVIAAVVRLLEATHIRVGNEEYARSNGSFGLSTLRTRHAAVAGATISLRFRGKSGVRHAVSLSDRRLARVVRRCQELPGQELFQYLDGEGATHRIDSADVNDYLREAAGAEVTAKDFRTWAGTLLAAEALLAATFTTAAEAKRQVVAAVAAVAGHLGNTPAVCRRCYVHPAIVEGHLAGSLAAALAAPSDGTAPEGLRPEEARLLAFLSVPR